MSNPKYNIITHHNQTTSTTTTPFKKHNLQYHYLNWREDHAVGGLPVLAVVVQYHYLNWGEDHAVGGLPVLAVVVQGLEQQLRGRRRTEVQANNLQQFFLTKCIHTQKGSRYSLQFTTKTLDVFEFYNVAIYI